ncbi:IS66 family insertion sequence element accessory protein TnpA [Flintibacter faecis]|uniref:IS66 family insertion sequence element accessory protein TnpA n=1 Tax=Flintibacter faecis TaxID=2763047 RepID=UPI003F501486
MTSTEVKHQARQQKWVAAIQDCRSSGLPVRQWCKQREITPSTYYRWEREVR